MGAFRSRYGRALDNTIVCPPSRYGREPVHSGAANRLRAAWLYRVAVMPEKMYSGKVPPLLAFSFDFDYLCT